LVFFFELCLFVLRANLANNLSACLITWMVGAFCEPAIFNLLIEVLCLTSIVETGGGVLKVLS